MSIIDCFFFVVIISIVHADSNKDATPEVCPANEEFAIDLRRCQNTCEEYGRMWDCPGYKPQGDCYCKKGFARIKENGKCVSVTKNATCAEQLPITPESCADNEYYTEQLDLGGCDFNTCLTYGCTLEYSYSGVYKKWSPRCECSNYSRRLKNGTCVSSTDPLCVAEYQPSPERCAAIGQIYQKNAPCQVACYGQVYCPPKGPTCVCPPNTVINRLIDYASTPTTEPPGGSNSGDEFQYAYLQSCYHERYCPTTTSPPA